MKNAWKSLLQGATQLSSAALRMLLPNLLFGLLMVQRLTVCFLALISDRFMVGFLELLFFGNNFLFLLL
jgi:hypothetical protein